MIMLVTFNKTVIYLKEQCRHHDTSILLVYSSDNKSKVYVNLDFLLPFFGSSSKDEEGI